MNGAGKAVGGQPLRHGVRLDEGAIDLIGLRCQDAVQSNGVGHGFFSRSWGSDNATDCGLISFAPTLNARASGPGPFPKKYRPEIRRIADIRGRSSDRGSISWLERRWE